MVLMKGLSPEATCLSDEYSDLEDQVLLEGIP